MRIVALALTLSVFLPVAARADDPPPPPPARKVLFIGNSYTEATRSALEGMYKAAGYDPSTMLEFATKDGYTLAKHAADEALATRITEGGWTHVVLQEQSQMPAYPQLRQQYLDAVGKLEARIRPVRAVTVLFATWGRRDGDLENKHTAPDYETMQELLSAGFAEATVRFGARVTVAPVDKAWATVRRRAPDLGRRLYLQDGGHPSAHGATLAATVLFRAINGTMPPAMRAVTMTDADAKLLLEISATACEGLR